MSAHLCSPCLCQLAHHRAANPATVMPSAEARWQHFGVLLPLGGMAQAQLTSRKRSISALLVRECLGTQWGSGYENHKKRRLGTQRDAIPTVTCNISITSKTGLLGARWPAPVDFISLIRWLNTGPGNGGPTFGLHMCGASDVICRSRSSALPQALKPS